jgi:hypothetical protein
MKGPSRWKFAQLVWILPRGFFNDYGDNYLQAEGVIARLMHHYNEERLHATLGCMTPAPGIVVNRMKFDERVQGE